MCWSVKVCIRGGWIIIAQDRLSTCSNMCCTWWGKEEHVLGCFYVEIRQDISLLRFRRLTFLFREFTRETAWGCGKGCLSFGMPSLKLSTAFPPFCLVVLIDSKIKIHYFFQTFCFPAIMIDDFVLSVSSLLIHVHEELYAERWCYVSGEKKRPVLHHVT